ncbi:MAG: UTRA domain-containing protein, partial [Spirochaetales bacterium]|nr:UTRA domain-containing protein [Spirochaetales bacterium]
MLDINSPVPLYFQLQEVLRKKIIRDIYSPGDLIPSEKELQDLYKVSRITVRNAINGLVLEDLLIKKQGKGTIVAFPRMQEDGNSTLKSFTEKMEQLGLKISTEVLDVARIPTPERIAEHLGIKAEEEIIYSKRLRKVDGEPIALFENYISTGTGVTEHDDFGGSIYKLLEEKYFIKISGAESLSVAGNIFLGQTEAPLMIKKYLETMNRSEILLVMIGGMATVAGGVLAAYVGFLGGEDKVLQLFYAKHLLDASVMAAPGAIVVAKILYPQTEEIESNIEIYN